MSVRPSGEYDFTEEQWTYRVHPATFRPTDGSGSEMVFLLGNPVDDGVALVDPPSGVGMLEMQKYRDLEMEVMNPGSYMPRVLVHVAVNPDFADNRKDIFLRLRTLEMVLRLDDKETSALNTLTGFTDWLPTAHYMSHRLCTERDSVSLGGGESLEPRFCTQWWDPLASSEPIHWVLLQNLITVAHDGELAGAEKGSAPGVSEHATPSRSATAPGTTHCGQDQALPTAKAKANWGKHTCKHKASAGALWDECLSYRAYTGEAITGCPGDMQCCPPASLASNHKTKNKNKRKQKKRGKKPKEVRDTGGIQIDPSVFID